MPEADWHGKVRKENALWRPQLAGRQRKDRMMSKSVEQAKAALATANAAYLSELERDCERGEGSINQERRREEHQQSLREDVAQCQRDLEEAERAEKAATPEMTEQQMLDRIKLLANEMDANDEENRAMQSEIDTLYAKIDAAKEPAN